MEKHLFSTLLAFNCYNYFGFWGFLSVLSLA